MKCVFFFFTGLSFTPTEFRLHKPVGDPQIASGDGLSVDDAQQSEFRRQRVHDQGQVSLSNLRTDGKQTGGICLKASTLISC